MANAVTVLAPNAGIQAAAGPLTAPRVPRIDYRANVGAPLLSSVRRSVSILTRDLELPECWTDATISAAANASERTTVAAKASRRRLNDKVRRIGGGL